MSAPSPYLQPTAYNKAAAAWTDAVSQGLTLLPYFSNGSLIEPIIPIHKLQYVVFSVEDVLALVSTVGARYIRAQFVLLPSEPGAVRFTVVLYALDSQRGRISAYYAGSIAKGSMDPILVKDPASDPGGNGALPVDLVRRWITGWQDVTDIAVDMFSTNYGPLQGYIFNLDDFIDPLFPSGSTTDHELRVYFGLHSYQVTSVNDTQLATTMGLILSIQQKEALRLPVTPRRYKAILVDSNGNALNDGDNGFYDLSHPNPPGAPPAGS